METPVRTLMPSASLTPRRSTRKSMKIIDDVILSASTKRKKRRTRKDTIVPIPRLDLENDEEIDAVPLQDGDNNAKTSGLDTNRKSLRKTPKKVDNEDDEMLQEVETPMEDMETNKRKSLRKSHKKTPKKVDLDKEDDKRNSMRKSLRNTPKVLGNHEENYDQEMVQDNITETPREKIGADNRKSGRKSLKKTPKKSDPEADKENYTEDEEMVQEYKTPKKPIDVDDKRNSMRKSLRRTPKVLGNDEDNHGPVQSIPKDNTSETLGKEIYADKRKSTRKSVKKTPKKSEPNADKEDAEDEEMVQDAKTPNKQLAVDDKRNSTRKSNRKTPKVIDNPDQDEEMLQDNKTETPREEINADKRKSLKKTPKRSDPDADKENYSKDEDIVQDYKTPNKQIEIGDKRNSMRKSSRRAPKVLNEEVQSIVQDNNTETPREEINAENRKSMRKSVKKTPKKSDVDDDEEDAEVEAMIQDYKTPNKVVDNDDKRKSMRKSVRKTPAELKGDVEASESRDEASNDSPSPQNDETTDESNKRKSKKMSSNNAPLEAVVMETNSDDVAHVEMEDNTSPLQEIKAPKMKSKNKKKSKKTSRKKTPSKTDDEMETIKSSSTESNNAMEHDIPFIDESPKEMDSPEPISVDESIQNKSVLKENDSPKNKTNSAKKTGSNRKSLRTPVISDSEIGSKIESNEPNTSEEPTVEEKDDKPLDKGTQTTEQRESRRFRNQSSINTPKNDEQQVPMDTTETSANGEDNEIANEALPSNDKETPNAKIVANKKKSLKTSFITSEVATEMELEAAENKSPSIKVPESETKKDSTWTLEDEEVAVQESAEPINSTNQDSNKKISKTKVPKIQLNDITLNSSLGISRLSVHDEDELSPSTPEPSTSNDSYNKRRTRNIQSAGKNVDNMKVEVDLVTPKPPKENEVIIVQSSNSARRSKNKSIVSLQNDDKENSIIQFELASEAAPKLNFSANENSENVFVFGTAMEVDAKETYMTPGARKHKPRKTRSIEKYFESIPDDSVIRDDTLNNENAVSDSLAEFEQNEKKVSAKNITMRKRKASKNVINFAEIHKRAYDRMESVVDNIERVKERAKLLGSTKPLSSLKKVQIKTSPVPSTSKAQRKMEFHLPTPKKPMSSTKKLQKSAKKGSPLTPRVKKNIVKPLIADKTPLKAKTPLKTNLSRLPNPPRAQKTVAVGSSKTPAKTPSKTEYTRNQIGSQKTPAKTPLKPLVNMSNIKPKVDTNLKSDKKPPTKDAVRNQQYQELYKGRTSISRNKGKEFLRGVRLNKRFELQLRMREAEEMKE